MSLHLTDAVPGWAFLLYVVLQNVVIGLLRARIRRLEDIPRQQIISHITSGRTTPEYAAEVIGKALRQRGAK